MKQRRVKVKEFDGQNMLQEVTRKSLPQRRSETKDDSTTGKHVHEKHIYHEPLCYIQFLKLKKKNLYFRNEQNKTRMMWIRI